MEAGERQTGATLAEFLIATPIVMIVGMTTVQAGLIYHGKTTLNYATFEAARAGAVNNAQLASMRNALGFRLSPVQGGDGSAEKALMAIAKSSLAVQDPTSTRLKVLNPTVAAFDDWGVSSQTTAGRVIPNNHLRHKTHDIGANSGLSLRDANLLKVHVTYGIDMKVPVVNSLIARSMAFVDPTNAHYYLRNKFPVSAVATVRMQSEAWEDEIELASLAALEGEAATEAQGTVNQPVVDGNANAPAVESGSGDEGGFASGAGGGASEQEGEGPIEAAQEGEAVDVSCNEQTNGLGNSPVLMDASVYQSEQCLITAPGYAETGVPSTAGILDQDVCE